MLQHPSCSSFCRHHPQAAISDFAGDNVPSAMPGTFLPWCSPEKVAFFPKERKESIFHHGRRKWIRNPILP